MFPATDTAALNPSPRAATLVPAIAALEPDRTEPLPPPPPLPTSHGPPREQTERPDSGNAAARKMAWNMPAPPTAGGSGGIMGGAASWPALAESARARPKPSSSDSLKSLSDGTLPPQEDLIVPPPLRRLMANPICTNNSSACPHPNAAAASSSQQNGNLDQPTQVRRGGGNLSRNNGGGDSGNSGGCSTDNSSNTSGCNGSSGSGGDGNWNNGGPGRGSSCNGSYGGGGRNMSINGRSSGASGNGNGSGNDSSNNGRDGGSGSGDGSSRNGGGSHWNNNGRSGGGSSNGFGGRGGYRNRRDHERGGNFSRRNYVRPSRVPQHYQPGPFPCPPPPPPYPHFILPQQFVPYRTPFAYPDMQTCYMPPLEQFQNMYLGPQPMQPFWVPAAGDPPQQTNPQEVPAENTLERRIWDQIHFYFSDTNLPTDTFLKELMNDQGWVPITLITDFYRMRRFMELVDTNYILDVIRGSRILEVQGNSIRRRNDWQRWLSPQGPSPAN